MAAVETTSAAAEAAAALVSVYIGNLHPDITDGQLYDLFSEFKTLASVRVCRDSSTAVSHRYGYVNFTSNEDAIHAIEKKNNSCLNGQKIRVMAFRDRVRYDPAKFTNLYIKNLDYQVTPEQLKEKFSEFGEIVSLAISKDDNGVSKGFGFVNFENHDDAKKALDALNGSQFGSKVLYVARAQTKLEREEFLRSQFEEIKKERMLKYHNSNTYIKNISDEVTDIQLRELFSQCGTIVSEKIMRTSKGISRGFGFVCFSNHIEANRAVETFHGVVFHGKPLYVGIAQNKEERFAQLQMKMTCQIPAGPPSIIPGYPVFRNSSPWVYNPLMGLRTDFAFRPPQVTLIDNYSRLQMQHMETIYGYNHQSQVDNRAASYNQAKPMQHMQTIYGYNHQSQGDNRAASYNRAVSYLPQSNNQQRGNYISRREREMNITVEGVASSAGNAVASVQEASNMLSSKLAAASPEEQKRILGERLYPLVKQHKPDNAEKITGMLLEMDNSELLVLLEAPESLVAKVGEAVKVLDLSKTFPPEFLVAKVEEVVKVAKVEEVVEVLNLSKTGGSSQDVLLETPESLGGGRS